MMSNDFVVLCVLYIFCRIFIRRLFHWFFFFLILIVLIFAVVFRSLLFV